MHGLIAQVDRILGFLVVAQDAARRAEERLVVAAHEDDKGAVVTQLPIGRGTDAAAFDPVRKLIFSSNGADGTIGRASGISVEAGRGNCV